MTLNHPQWRTINVTALPTPLRVVVESCGERSAENALALLHQTAEHPDEPGATIERIVFGVLNTHRGELEPVEADDGSPYSFGAFISAYLPQ